jgi:hypothetical protein
MSEMPLGLRQFGATPGTEMDGENAASIWLVNDDPVLIKYQTVVDDGVRAIKRIVTYAQVLNLLGHLFATMLHHYRRLSKNTVE